MMFRRVSIAIGIGLAISGCQSFPEIFDSDLSSKKVYEIAKEITVIIDGCGSAGSGVVFKKDATNTYSVLTANHVVKKAKGTCIILTSDKIQYEALVSKAIVPVDGVDLAVLTFVSNKTYKLAKFGDSEKATGGTIVYVAGAPKVSEAMPTRTVITPDGKIIGLQGDSSKVEGYNLIYNNDTSHGMSGGPVLNQKGEVIGIHGRGQNEYGIIGQNLGIPINKFLASNSAFIDENTSVWWITLFHFILFLVILCISMVIIAGISYTYYYLMYSKEQAEKKIENVFIIEFYILVSIGIITFFLGGRGIVDVYYHIEGNVRKELGDYAGAIAAYNQAININPNYAYAYEGRGIAYYKQQDYHNAIASYYWSIYFSNRHFSDAYFNRGLAKSALGKKDEAMADYTLVIERQPQAANSYENLGRFNSLLGRKAEAIADYEKAADLYKAQGKISDYQYAVQQIKKLSAQ